MSRHSLSTSNFKKNIIFIIKLIVVLILLAAYVNHVLPQYAQGYNASLLDKVDRLESIEGPKIVLVGNSNLPFGINSRMIEESMQMPVVDMGLHGGLGNAFQEEMAKYNVVPGDIYVLCHTDYNDNDQIVDGMTAWTAIENHYHLWKILRMKDIETMVRNFPVYLKKSLGLYASLAGNQDSGDVYSRSAFNEYGDISYIREENQEFDVGYGVPWIGDTSVNRINELNEYLNERGATLVVAAYPIYYYTEMSAEPAEYVSFQKQLADRLDCPVISNYVDYMFNCRYFYNSSLHLNSEGADLRTAQLIADLKRWQKLGTDADLSNDEYADILADDTLTRIEDISDYLDALLAAKDRYTILISVKDDALSNISQDIAAQLHLLGLGAELSSLQGESYLAVIEQGQVKTEELKKEMLETSGTLDEGRKSYQMVSGGRNAGNCSSIMINGQEYSLNESGFNIVVYSNETHRILDEVAFDIAAGDQKAVRWSEILN